MYSRRERKVIKSGDGQTEARTRGAEIFEAKERPEEESDG